MIWNDATMTILLGAGESNLVMEVGEVAASLYAWLGSALELGQCPADTKPPPEAVNPPEEADWPRIIPVAAYIECRFTPLDLDGPALEAALDSLHHSGWLWGREMVDTQAAFATVAVAPRGVPIWAPDWELRRRIREGVVSAEIEELARDLGLWVPHAPEPESSGPVGGSGGPASGSGGGARIDSLDEIAHEQREATDEVLERRKQQWRERGDEAEPFDDEWQRPQGVGNDGKYKANKHGLWRCYKEMYRDAVDADPPPLRTDNGKPNARAHKLGQIVDDYSIERAFDFIRETVSQWDRVQEATGWFDPPTVDRLLHLEDAVIAAIERGDNDPLSVIEDDDGGGSDFRGEFDYSDYEG